MASPVQFDELVAAGSLSAGAAVAVVQGNDTVRTTPAAFIHAVEKDGAIGDGVTNDTAAIQTALTAMGALGGGTVRGWPGKTYLVSFTGTKTILGTANRYCLLIPDGVFFDLNGATLKLAAAQNAAIVLNSTAGTTQNVSMGIGNGTLDGNESNQTTPAAGDMGCVMLYDVLRPRVENLRVINARQYFGRFLKIDKGYFNNLHGNRSDGDGWSFGISASSQHVTNTFIDNIYAEDCTNATYGTLQGNGFIATTKYCSIGKVECVNCGGGNKIQDDSIDTTWASSIFRGGANNTSNCGTKLQGGSGLKDLERISVGQIISENCHSSGLYWYESKDCHIGSYIGYNNGATGAVRDVDIQTSDRPSFGSMKVVKCGVTVNVSIAATVTDLDGGEVAIYNSVGRGVNMAGSGHIGVVKVIDGPDNAATEAVQITSQTSKGKIDLVVTNLDPDTDTSKQIAFIQGTGAAQNLNFEIGKIISGGTGELEGVVTLTNSSTTTAVANDNIWKEYSGTFVTDHYFQPIISLIPWNASARALEASGGFSYAVNRLSTVGTGFTINHASAGATDYVYWKVIGWKVVQRDSA